MGIQTTGGVSAFPRGKKVVSTEAKASQKLKREERNLTKEKELFGAVAVTDEGKANKAKAKKGRKKDKEDTDGATAVSVRLSTANPLSYNSLSEGQILLGCVAAVREFDLRVSLPGRLMGTVSIASVSKPYTAALEKMAEGKQDADGEVRPLADMFRVGQMVSTCVKEVAMSEETNFFQVTLSLMPQSVHSALPPGAVKKGMVLQAAIVSVEDHGYIMDVGIQGLKAFLGIKKTTKYVEEVLGGVAPTVGQLLPCFVTKADPHALNLSLEPMKVKRAELEPSEVSVQTMLPGMGFSAKVDKEIKGGWLLKMGDFSALLHEHHAPRKENAPDPEKMMHVRVLYVVPTVNTIYVTAREHLTFGKTTAEETMPAYDGVQIGSTIKDAKVLSSSNHGLLLRLNEQEDGEDAIGYVSSKHVSDTTISSKDIKTKYPVDSIQTCRVTQFDYTDRVFVCSTQKSIIQQKVLQASALKPGDKVSCTIKKYLAKGVLVSLGGKSEAFIPLLHLSDVPLSNPEKKFPVGTKMSCRVLRADPAKKKLHLTHKTILVKEEYPIISEFDPASVGTVTEGTVVSVSSDGLLLQLFGDVRGFVPKSQMSTELIEYPEKLFFLGQVLKCEVRQVDELQRRMTLSLIIGGTHKPLGSKQRKEGDNIKLGTLNDCEVTAVDEKGLSVTIKKKDEKQDKKEIEVKAFIPKNHLTDLVALADLLLGAYKVGDKITGALCFERDVLPIMSLKRSILREVEAKSLPTSFDDLREGVSVTGVVCLIKSYGVFVRLPTWKFRKSALIPMRYLADFFVEDPNEVIAMHQTLVGCVVERNEADNKITMSAKLSDIGAMDYDSESAVQRVMDFFRDMERVKSKATKKFKRNKEGTVVMAKVKEVMELGVSVDVGGVQGIITNSSGLPSSELTPGSEIPAVVLGVDFQFSCLQLSANSELVTRVTKSTRKKVKLGTAVKAEAVNEREEFGFVTMCIRAPGSMAGRFIHVACARHINDHAGFAEEFTTGETYNVIVKEVLEDSLGGDLIGVIDKKAKVVKRKRTESVSKDEKKTRKTSESEVVEKKNEKKRKRTESEVVSEEEVESETESKKQKSSAATKGKLTEATEDPGWEDDFDPWAKRPKAGDDSSEDDEAAGPKSKKLKTHISKRQKKALDKVEAEEIKQAEQRVLDGVENAAPESAEDYDRLVLASPNASLVWIKYMAFHMGRSEAEKAREVVRRALEKINFREDEEKLNVYMAWFNLEIASGEEEKAEEVFSKAVKYNDEYKVYMQAAHTYATGGNHEKAEKLYKTMAKKFCKEPEVWIKLGTFYFQRKNLKEARFTLQRSVQNLEKKNHVDITSRFAQLEFKLGETDRAKTIFETILGNYPKRIDLWCVYADQLIKAKEQEAARAVYERATGLHLPPKKMKALFKRWLEMEEATGERERVDAVRRRALEYVEAKVGVSSSAMDVDE